MRSFHKLAIALAVALVPASKADPIVSFSGFLDADVVGNLHDLSVTPHYTSALEADVATKVTFSEAVSVDLFATAVQGRVPANGTGVSGRWPALAFDGLALNWQASEMLALTVGDLAYQKGMFNYYFYKRYALITPETFLRGVALKSSGATLYIGSNDIGDQAFTVAGGYLHETEGMTVEPFADVTFGLDELAWNAGIDFNIQKEEFKVHAAASVFQNGGSDLGYALLVEPSFVSGDFSLAASAYFSPRADDPSLTPSRKFYSSVTDPLTGVVTSSGFISEEFFIYVEPGLSLTPAVGVGLPLEYHAFDLDNSDLSQIWVVPTVYLYPAEGVQWWLWTQAVMPMADGADMAFYAGSEIIVNF